MDVVTPYVILAGLIGAIAWDLITWYFGLPTQFLARAAWRICGSGHGESRYDAGSVFNSFDALNPERLDSNTRVHPDCAAAGHAAGVHLS